MLTFAVSMLLQGTTAVTTAAAPASPAAHDPAYSRDGRLAVSVDGDLWIVAKSGQWSRVTSGPAWDREPAWSPDGASIVYSSDASGNFDLWRVSIGANDAPGTPERITTSPLADSKPAVTRDGRIIFVRGRLGAAALWVRQPDGAESRLTHDRAAEDWPVLSPDGNRVAYVSIADNTHKLHVRNLDGGRDDVAATDPRLEHPAWATTGDRISWTAAGARGGVFVSPLDGRYVNLLSAHYAESAWSPDGKTVALADIPANDPIANVSYNGDPDRTGDRDANLLAESNGGLWTVDAPVPPDLHLAAQAGTAALTDRARHNADAFDQVWTRTAALYYSTPDAAARRARWEALRAAYRPRAIAAATDDELKTVIHDLLRDHPPYRQAATGRAAVSSAHPVATAAGVEMLAKGGNVVDAAVAISFALGVVEPDASGPGGYGQMVIYQKGMARPQLIEFMSRVPEDAGLTNTSLLQNGRLPDGPAVVNVPGTVAAMYLAWQKFGSRKLPWSDLLQPAIRAARDGYVVSEGLATTLATEREQFLKSEGARALYFRDDQPLHAGDTLRNPDLAWTLEQIARGGADAFYKGEVARRMVTDLHAHGNAMKLSDMARYYAAERDPVSSTYRGYTFFASAPPVSGGAELAAKLNMLELYPNPKPYSDDAGTLHAMIAAWQLVPSTRNRIADPGLWPVDIEPFVNKDTARIRWSCFDPNHALNTAMLRGDTLSCAKPGTKAASVELSSPPECYAHGYDANQASSCRAAGTTAFAVADADGNMVAATQTLGTWGGNFYVTPGLGFLYNDKLGSYGTDPNSYGARLPFARHGSTITPTLVFEGTGRSLRPVMAFGAAGNAWITSAVYQTFIGMIDQHLDPQAALELPRFLIGGGGRGGANANTGATIQMEDGFSPAVMKRLAELGYRTQIVSLPGELREGYGAAVRIENGRVTAGADPRRAGAAGAIP
ncbi:MAG TPA: gamma-glutamyltransferase [Gemmatimonadaceae bacterium]|jgi:gamma-glutamyltranspeptidase|nr:gamma-glutamyltransferase [Gemmatimonadaceae bacterium]